MIDRYVYELVQYGIDNRLLPEEDKTYVINRLLEVLQKNDITPENETETKEEDLESILKALLDYAAEKKLIAENTVTYRDLFDTKLMGCLVPRPSEVIRTFYDKYEESPMEATDYFYQFSQNTDYIRRYRVCKDLKWKCETEFGDLDITINLSKPEKDPKAIAAARNAKQSSYPKCLLCRENEGYAGRVGHPARQNHRVIPIKIAGKNWYLQYSPYVYYNEHCICFNGEHVPMKIERDTFCKLLDFVSQFPHYFVGSNADLPIVGGSILSHDHFQGGHYQFAMEKAPIDEQLTFKGFEDVEAGIVKWPMSVIRLRSENKDRLIDLADQILGSWRGYTDEDAFVYAYTTEEEDGEKKKVPHNTITPIARFREGKFELDLVLRNNITTKEHPLGVYHPHAKLHHIKKENIGLIEVMGLAVLPSRLKNEMEELEEAYRNHENIAEHETLQKHAEWFADICDRRKDLTNENIGSILRDEIGKVFCKVLEDAGVYKYTKEGRKNFLKFIQYINEQ